MPKPREGFLSSPLSRTDVKKENAPETTSNVGLLITIVIAIANLILTALLGVYLAVRNENLQKQLVDLQNQIQYAKISVTSNCDTEVICAVKIINDGPSTAKNLRVVFLLREINDNWKTDLINSANIDIVLDNPSLQHETTNENVSITDNTTSPMPNAKLIMINALPPQTTITLTPILSYRPYILNNTVTLVIKPENTSINSISTPQGTFMQLVATRVAKQQYATQVALLGQQQFETPTPDSTLWAPSTTPEPDSTLWWNTNTLATAISHQPISQSFLSAAYNETIKFIESNYLIASMTASASCDNCSGDSQDLPYSMSAIQKFSSDPPPSDITNSQNWVFHVTSISGVEEVQPIFLETTYDPQQISSVKLDLVSP